FAAQLGFFFKRREDCGAAVLAIVDNEFSIHRHFERAETTLIFLNVERLELNLGVYGGCDNRKHISLRVIEDGLGNFRRTILIQRSLGAKFRWKFLFVENGYLLKCPQCPHRNVVFVSGLNATDDWETESGHRFHHFRSLLNY